MTAIRIQAKPQRSSDITFQSMPPETILLNLENGYYYSTNSLGSAVWQKCDGNTSIEDLISDLQPQYEISLEVLRHDVMEFIEEMVAENLLKVDTDA